MADKIFFSYSRFDSAFVLRLANDLRNAGGNIWLDQLDIAPGKHWDTEIENALNTADCVLAIISPKSLSSDNAMDEVSYALEEKKRVIPVLLTETETSFRLRRLQRVDFTVDYDIGFKQLLAALNLEKSVPAQHAADITEQDRDEELWLKCYQENTVSSYQRYLRTTTTKSHFDEALRMLDKLQDKPLSRAINLPKSNAEPANRLINKKSIILIASLILLAIIGWSAYQMIGRNKEEKEMAIQNPPEIAKSDSVQQPTDTMITEAEQQTPDTIPAEKVESHKPKPGALNEETRKKPGTKPADVAQPPVDDKPEEVVTTTTGTEVITPPAPIEKKQVTIYSKVVVPLLLIDNPDMHERKKTEQFLKFSVESDVVYQGVLIIQKGATAKGSLTIGSRWTDIRIFGVTAVDGSFVVLKSEAERGRRDEVETNRHYRAIIKEGTRIGN